MNTKTYPLSLNGDTFNSFKSDFDSMLRQLLTEMGKWECDEATISAKIVVKLEQDTARDYLCNGYDGVRDITKPTFKHEIGTVMQAKSKKTGSLGGELELVWDKELQQYIMRNIENGQTTLFDEGEVVDADYHVIEDEGHMIGDGSQSNPPEEGMDTADEKSEYTPFEWMTQFIGEQLKITEALGNFTVRTMSNHVVLSSATAEDSQFYCPAEKLAPHVDHTVVCVGYGGDDIVNISVECEDCCDVLFSIDAPEEPEADDDVIDSADTNSEETETASNDEEHEYGYEKPEDDFGETDVADKNGFYSDL